MVKQPSLIGFYYPREGSGGGISFLAPIKLPFYERAPAGSSESIDGTGKIRGMEEGEWWLTSVSREWNIYWKRCTMAPKAQIAQVLQGLQGQKWPLRSLRGCHGVRGHKNGSHSQHTQGSKVFQVVGFKSEVKFDIKGHWDSFKDTMATTIKLPC